MASDDFFQACESEKLHLTVIFPKLAWYSPSAPCWICLYGLESIFLGLPDLARLSTFLQPKWNFLNHLLTLLWSSTASSFTQQMFLIASTVLWPTLNCAVTFDPTNVFGCFYSLMIQFKLGKHKFLNWTTLHIHQWGFQITHEMEPCTCWHTNYYHPQFELFQSSGTHATK